MEMKNKLKKLVELTLKKNEVMNLTAITNPDEFYEKMILDCLMVGELCSLKGEILDIGTGGGFPGLPLAIKYPSLHITLLDATSKKIAHINEVINILKLSNVEACAARAEQFIDNRREKYDFVLSRAVSQLNILLELTLPYAKTGGYVIAMKGPKYLKEIKAAEKALNKLNARIMEIKEYTLPISKEKHNLIIIKKLGSTPKKYPRDYSLIKSKPL